MAVVKELLRAEQDGSLSFGNYELPEKTKLSDFELNGDLYKVKTFREITKLERNEMLVYESEPGSAVNSFKETGEGVTFTVQAPTDVQVILGLEESTNYRVYIDGEDNGIVQTNSGGKLILSVEMQTGNPVKVEVRKD